jgi:hypothetical protein
LPQQRADFALDLNGDGIADNQYGALVAAFTSQGGNSQGAMSAAVASGANLVLVTAAAHDPLFTTDACAGATLLAGVKPATAPRYDGTDVFTVDSSIAVSQFAGPIVAGRFDSANPATATAPPSASVTLVFGLVPIRVTLIGAHLSLQRDSAGNTTGQLNGAIRGSDLQTVVVPQFTQALNATLASDPTGATSQQILAVFDNGGSIADPACGTTCRNPDGSCAVAGDKIISLCEVSTNSLVRPVLTPDVQMFAADGSYKPNPANTAKDSLSVGVALTLVRASY